MTWQLLWELDFLASSPDMRAVITPKRFRTDAMNDTPRPEAMAPDSENPGDAEAKARSPKVSKAMSTPRSWSTKPPR